MHAHPVARVYAEALFAIARERGAMDDIGTALSEVAALVREHDDVRAFLEAPMLDAEPKKQALEQALRDRVAPVLTDFLCLLIDKDRIQALDSIATAYGDLADQESGRKRVHAASAVPIPTDLQERLVGLLREHLHADCVLETDVRPDLIGGLVLTVDDQIFDGSVSGKLKRISREMMRSSGYED